MQLVLARDKVPVLSGCVAIAQELPDYFTDAGVRTLEEDASCHDLYVEAQDGQVVAFAVIGEKGRAVREVLWMAVRRDRQGVGIGSRLLAEVEQAIQADGARVLEVKTLGAAADYPPYEKTRRFYEHAGFFLLDVIHPYPGWDEDSPCAIYAKPLRKQYIGAYGVLVQSGRALLVRKARGPYTGSLDLPGGGLEYGEAPEEAVVRELAEETGQAVRVAGVLPPFSLLLENQQHLGFVFQLELVEERPLLTQPDGQDSGGAVWVPVDNLPRLALSPLVRHAFQQTWRVR